MTQPQYVDPTRPQIEALAGSADAGPITMLNLVRYAGDAGREEYARYCREVQVHLDRVGATATYAGSPAEVVIGEDGEVWWDAILLVTYPSRAAFLAMVSDPDYLAVSEIRSGALSDSRLIVTEPWGAAR